MDLAKIMTEGVVFKKAKETSEANDKKIKTKAKKTTYAKGTHNSGAAKMKAAYKKKKAQRNRQ